jgi:hypothetical protein
MNFARQYAPRIAGPVLFFLAGLLALTSCSRSKPLRPAPPTFPVSGEVKLDGGKVPPGSTIEFRPENNEKAAELTAKGVVHASGKFTLCILYIDRILPGALEGPHTVSISFPSSNSSNSSYSSGLISIPEKFTVEPRENYFTVTVPKS